MELKTFEQMRVRKMFKLFFLLLLNTALAIVSIWYAIKLDIDSLLYILVFVYFFIYCMVLSIPKNFENDVKKALLPYLLKNILKEDGEIKWQGERYETEAKSPKEKIIEDLENYINNHCTSSKDADDNFDKYIQSIDEEVELEKKDSLTQAEEFRLRELKIFIEEENKKMEVKAEEKYNIRSRLLKILENNSLNQTSEEDLIKIKYLKKENEHYEESKEYDALCLKKGEGLTEQEQARIEYLEKNLEAYRNDMDERFDKILSDSNRFICLYEIFNRSISYDDVFYGNYKGIEFLVIEGREEKIFNGTVIRIPLKKEFNNTLLVLSTKFNTIPYAGIVGLQTNLHSMKLKNLGKHSVWAENSSNIADILEDKFVQYVQNSNNAFSYMFKEGFVYLIWPHQKDFFKLGSLFKKVDDQKQYQNFEKDIRSMLYEIEKLNNCL